MSNSWKSYDSKLGLPKIVLMLSSWKTMVACFGVWMAREPHQRGSAVAHISGSHVSGLRQLWCSVMRSVVGGETPVKSLPGTRAWGLGAILPLPHHPHIIFPKILSNFTVSQICFLNQNPHCCLPSSILISHLSHWIGQWMGISTCNLSTPVPAEHTTRLILIPYRFALVMNCCFKKPSDFPGHLRNELKPQPGFPALSSHFKHRASS